MFWCSKKTRKNWQNPKYNFNASNSTTLEKISKACWICSKLKKKHTRRYHCRRFGVFIVNFKQILLSVWVFFHEDSRIIGLQGKGKEIFILSPHYHFQPLHRNLDISQEINAENSLLHIASSRTLWADFR